jgi:hypothetical protein
MLCEGEIALDQGRTESAQALLDAALRAFAPLGMTWHQGQATRLLQRLSHGAATVELRGESR